REAPGRHRGSRRRHCRHAAARDDADWRSRSWKGSTAATTSSLRTRSTTLRSLNDCPARSRRQSRDAPASARDPRSRLDPGHPDIAETLNYLGVAYMDVDLDSAPAMLQRALRT